MCLSSAITSARIGTTAGRRKQTSSSSDGNIFRILKPSVNLSKTPVRPFINDIFSSRVFAVKFDRSKKFSVEIGSEEKKGWDGRVDGVGLLWDPRVMSDRKRSGVLDIRLG